jgi:Tfp pilus assembly protein PilN
MEEHEKVAAPAEPTRVSWASIPRVNLLPLEIIQKRRFRRVRRMLGVMVVAAVLICTGGVFWAQRGVSSATARLTTAQSEVTSLQTQAAKYSAVPEVVAQVEAAKTARTSAMGNDVLWYQFVNDLRGALPAGVAQEAVTVVLTQSAGSAVAANPLSPAGIGTLSITGSADQYQQISAWLDALTKITGVSAPTLINATKSQDGTGSSVTYSISAVLTEAALSHRYDDKKGS